MFKKVRYFVGDFETTVYDNQDHTEVWASALVELFTDDVLIHHSISETLKYLISLNSNIICYYHNLKFDGSFWLSYLLVDLKMKQAVIHKPDSKVEFMLDKDMPNNTIKYSISDMGEWYSITIKIKNHYIIFRDSLKLLPFSVQRIGDSFKTKHKKLNMEYTGYRYAGCEITDLEKQYIANDVLVVKEALEIMFNEGHKKLTIGACCLSEYKTIIEKDRYDRWFPDLYHMPLDSSVYTYNNVDEYIRKSYKGGWCYVVKGKENQIKYNGTTADVNSLYPSMMSSESGNKYPIGEPTFWNGNYIPPIALRWDKYYFIRIKTRFYLKPNMLPCIQIKNNLLYNGTEWLKTSDILNPTDHTYSPYYRDIHNNIYNTRVVLTLTMTDYQLIKEHYDLVDFEILDGCYFDSQIGIFDEYINKYKKIKLESKGAIRELAKLFLNNLYGKMGTSPNSSFKYAYIKDDETIGFTEIKEYNKKVGYIPVGSAITSYARNFTIRAAQKNYYGVDKQGFIYADTDSIHCDLPPQQIIGIKVDPKDFCCWKLESSWDKAIFVRQKTYIEHVVTEDLEPIDEPYYSVKCAGMPERCKNYFIKSMEGLTQKEWETEYKEEWEEMSEEAKEFVLQKRDLTDFKLGLIITGKLLPKRIKGGILLTETTYEMR